MPPGESPWQRTDRGRRERCAALVLVRRAWATHGDYDGPRETAEERAARVERMASHVAAGLSPRGREVRWPDGRPLADVVVELGLEELPGLFEVARLEDALAVRRAHRRERRRAERARAAARCSR